MAQWNHTDRTVFTKIVYYGPAFGGKTTNLESLHRITDPQNTQELLTIKTSDDRTLFFDLLPFDLGDILGYQVALKLYTVPGQVRYDATRQVVLSGTDAIVFVADSSAGRSEQNRWSLQNLRMNMRAKRLDPASIPVIFQFNKQDLPEAASPQEVASWFNIRADQGFPSVATHDEGVLETFMATTAEMLRRLVERADERTRRDIDMDQLAASVERAFDPYLARLERMRQAADSAAIAEAPPVQTLIGESDDLLQNAIQASVQLGEQVAIEKGRVSRLEREAEAFRRISDSLHRVGASVERVTILDTVLAAAAEILDAQAVSLLRLDGAGHVHSEGTWNGIGDALLGFGESEPLLQRIVRSGQPCVVEDLAAECSDAAAPRRLYGLKSALAVPVGEDGTRTLIVYGRFPDGRFSSQDVRYLATLAGHLGVGLEKARAHLELRRSRDELEQTVARRTAQIRRSNDELRELDRLKDRFLAGLSHEMKSPLTAILSSAVVLRDYKSETTERQEMIDTIITAGEALQQRLDDLFRLVQLGSEPQALELTDTDAAGLVHEALQLAGRGEFRVDLDERARELRGDLPLLARALANLIDNAVKFSPEEIPVEIHVGPSELHHGAERLPCLVFSVLDRGPGVPASERESIFSPFEQGGDSMTDKPAGIGAGLYETRTIAARHGGTVEYVPRDGGGSEFRLSVPLTAMPRTEPAEIARA